MYRLIVESLLGLHIEVDKLRIAPCLPDDFVTLIDDGQDHQIEFEMQSTVVSQQA